MSAAITGVACVTASLVAAGCAAALARNAHRHRLSMDDEAGPQKLHRTPTPRIGGVAVALGVLAGVCTEQALAGAVSTAWIFLACVMPGLIWGLIEDFSKRGAVLVRLVLTGVSAMLGFVLLDARITEVGLPLVDSLLAVPAFSFAFTVLAVAGAGHAMNIIDGLNGLAGMNALLASAGLAVVAWIVGDTFVFSLACVLAASVAGFLLINYPGGRIFLGDGGAYLAGLMLAELSILLVQRNSEVSPWFPVVLLAYPVWETIFSVYRRRIHGSSPGHADALHLHSLVYRRVVRWNGGPGSASDCVTRNSLASLVLWGLPLLCWIFAIALWNFTAALQAAAIGFVILYGLLYRQIVRFGIPAWLVIRLDVQAAAASDYVRAMTADADPVAEGR